MIRALLAAALAIVIVPTIYFAASDSDAHFPADAPVAADTANVVIKAPASIKVGQLVVLDASESTAASFQWQVVPPTDNFQVIDGGKRAVFSTSIDETADDYMFIVAVAKGDAVALKTWRIEVTGRTTSATVSDAGLVNKVAQWCQAVTSPTKREDLTKLAQSFSSVAEAAKSTTMTPDAMVQATTQSNLKALGADNLKNWSPFFTSLQEELKSLDTAGKLPDGVAHIQAWEQIADGLTKYAASL